MERHTGWIRSTLREFQCLPVHVRTKHISSACRMGLQGSLSSQVPIEKDYHRVNRDPSAWATYWAGKRSVFTILRQQSSNLKCRTFLSAKIQNTHCEFTPKVTPNGPVSKTTDPLHSEHAKENILSLLQSLMGCLGNTWTSWELIKMNVCSNESVRTVSYCKKPHTLMSLTYVYLKMLSWISPG